VKTLILGLGNPILSDDGVGCHVVRALKDSVREPAVTVTEASVGGLDFLELLAGYDKAIIIDAIQTAEGRPGQIYQLEPELFADTQHSSTPHDVNFATAMELGKQLGLPLPGQITIFAIEVKDVTSFGEACTPEVMAAIPTCVDLVLQELSGHHGAVTSSDIGELRHDQ
jgi:hydrogenase maturation protease